MLNRLHRLAASSMQRRFVITVLVAAACFINLGSVVYAAVRTVGPYGSGKQYTGPNGIQAAINAAAQHDTIKVWPGTYNPFVVNPRDSETTKSVKIVSTYDPTHPPTLAELDEAAGDENLGNIPSNHPAYAIRHTIIGQENPVNRINAIAVYLNGWEDETTELSGFTITGMELWDNHIHASAIDAGYDGGHPGRLRIAYNIIHKNGAGGDSARSGICHAAGVIENNIFSYNSRFALTDSGSGPGLSPLVVRRNIFRQNKSSFSDSGGNWEATAIQSLYYAVIQDNIVHDNQGSNANYRPFPHAIAGLTQCLVERNIVYRNSGSGIADTWGCVIRNNLIFRNAQGGIRHVYPYATDAFVLNNTIWGNGADVLADGYPNNPDSNVRWPGAGISLNKLNDDYSTQCPPCLTAPHVFVRNNILWANVCDPNYVSNSTIKQFYAERDGSWGWYARYHLEDNCIQDWPGDNNDQTHHRLQNNNIVGNPRFIDDTGDTLSELDFHLSTSPQMSSCIDSGITIASLRDDLEWRSRPRDGNDDSVEAYDIGAYECGSAPPAGTGNRSFTLKDYAGYPVVQFWSDGNIFVNYGSVVKQATDAQLQPTSAKEFIVKHGSTVVMRIPLTQAPGDAKGMYVKGLIQKADYPLVSNPNYDEVIFKNNTQVGNNIEILIMEAGHLVMRGDMYVQGQMITP